ncbi:MAG TPA: heme-binding domain-containing protein [Acidimicrobiales bacterium]|jgi:hypothetical protein|nr:heme-binding domain-containing protein [Acidimicrobiales bacterium]
MATSDRAGRRRILGRLALAGLAVFVALQLVPYGWSHPNPPVTQDAPWPDAASEEIARTSCYDCHSNETDWPVYAYVAPMSWLVRRDVEGGRDHLNFSRWDEGEADVDDAVDAVEDGSMPPRQYTLVHRGATLSDAEVDRLVAALEAMDDSGGGDDRGSAGDGGRGESGDEGDSDPGGGGSGRGGGSDG